MANTSNIPALKAILEDINTQLKLFTTREIPELEHFFLQIPYSISIDITSCSELTYNIARKAVLTAVSKRTMKTLLKQHPAVVHTYAQYNLGLLIDRCDAFVEIIDDAAETLVVIEAGNSDVGVVWEMKKINEDIVSLTKVCKHAGEVLDKMGKKYVSDLASF